MNLVSQVRKGDYRDSIQLMQLQAALESMPGVEAAVAMMGTADNLTLLSGSGWPVETGGAGVNDLYVGVRAGSAAQAEAALEKVPELLRRRGAAAATQYRPRSLEGAFRQLPEARWALVSTPGIHAPALARRALELDRNVFLFSDHVSLADETALKAEARRRGLLVMGPDCGTALVNGIGFGFANAVRRGDVGLVGSSGTGLQSVSCRIHALGGGVSHALGVGGRDLSDEVGAASALQAFELLRRDASTRVVALVAKPPGPRTAAGLIARLRRFPKPVAACFLGHPAPASRLGSLRFASNLSELAHLSLSLVEEGDSAQDEERVRPSGSNRRWLRGLFGGGTLAAEALQRLQCSLTPIHSNLTSPAVLPLEDLSQSEGHTVIDLGDDAFTQGRPHPMIDPGLMVERLKREAADPETACLVFDVVLGHGAHADPAGRIAPVLESLRGSGVEFLALLVGTDQDPQNMDVQRQRLEAAGAVVFTDSRPLWDRVEGALTEVSAGADVPTVSREALQAPVAAVNVGLEAFYDSLREQGATALHVDWRPPASGDPDLAALLERMKKS